MSEDIVLDSTDETPPDPKTRPRSEQILGLQHASSSIHAMYFNKSISEGVFYNMLIRLAKDWVDLDEKQEARDVLSGISEKYLQETMPDHMRDDEDFHKVVHGLALALSETATSEDDSAVDLAILRGPTGQA